MAFYDMAAAHALKPLNFSATAVSFTYAVAQVSPPDLGRIPATAVSLDLLISSASAINTDVEIVVDNDASFASPVYSNTLTNRADGPTNVVVGGLVNGTKYYWRVRASETGMAAWTAWSPVWAFTPDTNSGKAFGYADNNNAPTPDAAALTVGELYVDMNVGFPDNRIGLAIQYTDRNVGFEIAWKSEGFGYAYVGDVNELTPVPHIWFLKPKSGRPGDGIRIICFGVGDLQTTFDGVVEAYYGPVIGWQAVPVIDWQTNLPSVNAYTADRVIDEVAEFIDPQHSVIEITVPLDALPPGVPVRIRTEGP